jgi:hypothetical protein
MKMTGYKPDRLSPAAPRAWQIAKATAEVDVILQMSG